MLEAKKGLMGNRAEYISIILKTAVEHSKAPFALSLPGERGFGMLTKWVHVVGRSNFDRLSRNSFFVFLKSMAYKQTKIQKITSNSDCFLVMPYPAHRAYSA